MARADETAVMASTTRLGALTFVIFLDLPRSQKFSRDGSTSIYTENIIFNEEHCAEDGGKCYQTLIYILMGNYELLDISIYIWI